MSRGGKVNFAQLNKFVSKVEKELNDEQIELFIEKCAKKLAGMLLRGTVQKTPVGEYPKYLHKQGGTLRRGWTVDVPKKYGDIFTIDVINNVEYASYVEHGHRTIDHKRFIDGRHMLKFTVEEIQNIAPEFLEKQLRIKLKAVFNNGNTQSDN